MEFILTILSSRFIKHQLEKRLDQKLRDRHESESGSDKKTPSLVKDTSASSRRFSRVLQSPKNMGPIFPRASTSYNANRFSIVAQAAAAIDQDSLPIHARIQGNAVTCVQASENQPNDSDFIRVDVG